MDSRLCGNDSLPSVAFAAGRMVYLGRSDDQVQIRGHRIELGEIDAALVADESVRAAVTTTHGEGDRAHLVSYVTVTAGAHGQAAAVRAVSGVDELSSYVNEGNSRTMVQFAIGTPIDRAVNDGLTLDRQQHTQPVWSLGDPSRADLLAVLAGAVGITAAILA